MRIASLLALVALGCGADQELYDIKIRQLAACEASNAQIAAEAADNRAALDALRERADVLEVQALACSACAETDRRQEEGRTRAAIRALGKTQPADISPYLTKSARSAPARSERALCCDGTVSPTCGCGGGRGCCSHHGGVCGCN